MATTSPDKIYSPDAGQQYALTQDLLAMADSVQDALDANRPRYRSGTSAERGAWTSPGEGALFYNTTTDILEVYDGLTWVRVWPQLRTRARFVGATSSTGTVTVNHLLGATPIYIGVTDTTAGAVPQSREIRVSAQNSTQIQFVVYYGGSPLAGNPVEFYWEATL